MANAEPPASTPLRVLFAIPHYFGPAAAGAYGSQRGAREARAAVVRASIASLWQNFSAAQSLLDGHRRRFHPANPALSATIEIALCTTGDNHLLPELEGIGFRPVDTGAEPLHLGFACHRVLRDGLGQFDYFAYLEDDLRLADPLFFAKLTWFKREFGDAAVLQPNRFELAEDPAPYKLYIDGPPHNPRPGVDQRSDGPARLAATAMGLPLAFQRVPNPHAGCFFLNAAQLAHWAGRSDFATPEAAFYGPLESAATLGVMRHFRMYKPARENAAFLEIEHLDPRYLGRHFRPVAGAPPQLPWKLHPV